MNQLGNIIVASNITTAIQISKKINHRYRVISLDGELIHVGGIMTGGSLKTSNSFISDKYELEKLKLSTDALVNDIKTSEKKVLSYEDELNIIKDSIYKLNIELVSNNETVNSKKIQLDNLTNEYNIILHLNETK